MIEISNLPPPYDYVKDELNVYTFYTKSGAKYIAYFIEEYSIKKNGLNYTTLRKNILFITMKKTI